MPELSRADSLHLEAAKGGLELEKPSEANSEPEWILPVHRAHLFVQGRDTATKQDAGALLFQARPPMVDSFNLLSGRIRTHAGGGAYERMLVSGAVAQGGAGFRLEAVTIGEHRHGRGADRVPYTDHFAVTLRMWAATLPDRPTQLRSRMPSR